MHLGQPAPWVTDSCVPPITWIRFAFRSIEGVEPPLRSLDLGDDPVSKSAADDVP